MAHKTIQDRLMKTQLLACLVLGVSTCWADVNQVKELLQSTLRESPDGALHQGEEFDLNQHDSAHDLGPSEIAPLLPAAAHGLRSGAEPCSFRSNSSP